jgi:hypothetical protein
MYPFWRFETTVFSYSEPKNSPPPPPPPPCLPPNPKVVVGRAVICTLESVSCEFDIPLQRIPLGPPQIIGLGNYPVCWTGGLHVSMELVGTKLQIRDYQKKKKKIESPPTPATPQKKNSPAHV